MRLRKIIPGVTVAEVDLGNKTEAEAIGLLEQRFVKFSAAKLTFVFEGEKLSKSLSDWGVDFEATSSERTAYVLGRKGGVFKTTRDKFRAWFGEVSIPPKFELNEERFEENLAELREKFYQPEKDATFEISEEGLEISDSEVGQGVNEGELKAEISSAATDLDFSLRELPVVALQPKVRAENLSQIKDQVETVVFSSPQFTFGSRSWTLSPEEVLALLEFSAGEVSAGESRPIPQPSRLDPRNLEGSSSGGLRDATVGKLVEVTSCEVELNSFISELASEIDRPARGGIFELENGRVISFALPHPGYKLDEAEAKKLVSEVLLGLEKSQVKLPVAVENPPEQKENEYGIKTLLGEGVSNFKGSIAGRVHNIDLATSRLDGVLIPPGETFSFNQSLGEVSSETGYKTSYVTKDGRPLLGIGGGVCQVSTTMFRAALYSGLPILERTAHAYRVHYYEHFKGPGFDATVYEPSPDLKFKNDTPAYVLIKRYFDAPTNTVKFELYGTSDGRKTEVIGPIIHSQTAPPKPAYVPDPTLPKGVTKQVDWAAWGAKVTVKRKVTRGGEVLQDDAFFSNFQPWQAIYLVGTGT